MDALTILKQKIKEKSIGKVAKELGKSKATISLVARKQYPNPYKIYGLIKEKYTDIEIVGAQPTQSVFEILKEIENGD